MTEPKNYRLTAEAGIFTASGSSARLRALRRLPDDHPMYLVLGRIVSEWSHLEHMLDLIIWDLVHHDKVKVACITSQLMGVGPRVKTILNLLSLRSKQDVSNTIGRLNSLNQKSF